jgi:methionine-rich copper-binding protein CopC
VQVCSSRFPFPGICALLIMTFLAGCGSVTKKGSGGAGGPTSPTSPTGTGPAPTVTAVGLQTNGVAPNRMQEVQFSEAIDSTTINSKTFTITDASGKAVAGTVAYDADYNVASFKPMPALQPSTAYTATITTGVSSAGGVHLQSGYTYNFTTIATSDATPISVAQVNPAANATCASATAPITVTFSEAPDVSTLTTANVLLKGPDGSVLKNTLSISVDKAQMVVTPESALPSGAVTVTVQSVGDMAGNMIAAPYTWSFSTNCQSSGGGGGGGGTGGNSVEYLYSSAYTQGGNIFGFKIDMSTGNLTPLQGSPFKEDAGPQMGCTVGCSLGLLADPMGRFVFYSEGTGSMKVDATTGALTEVGNTPPANEGNFKTDPSGRFLYAGGSGGGGATDSVIGWEIGSNGQLTTAPGSPYGFGGTTTYGDPGVTSNFVFITSYAGASTAMVYGFKIDQNTGALTQVSTTPDGQGGSLSVVTPDGKFLYSENEYQSGQYFLAQIVGYSINSDGTLTPIKMDPQQTPDQILTNLYISPNGKFLYEMGSSAMRVYSIDANTGALTQTVTDTTNHVGGYIYFDPTDKYAYGVPAYGSQNNISGNNIQGYAVDQNTGALTPISTAIATLPNAPQTLAIVRPQ